jgi:PPOX class probable F420-dependent enzyme
MPMKKKDIEKLLKKPIVAVVAVTAPDGAPHAVPTWYEYADGQVVFHTGPESFKYKCLVRDPRVTLVVDTKKAPYKTVVLKGRATLEEKIDDKRTERMAIEYLGKKLGKAYAKSLKGNKVAVVSFKPSHTVSWDYSQESP